MTIAASTLRKLAGLALSSEQMAGVLDILAGHEEAEEARKAAQRERTQRAREKQRNVTVTLPFGDDRGYDTRGGVARVEDKTSTSEKEPQKEESKKDALRVEFDTVFWPAYPHKVGKPKALIEFRAARGRAELAAIMDGLARYVANKPAERAWLNPATFLHQDRYADQPAAVVVPMARGQPPPRRNLADFIAERQRMNAYDDTRPSEAPVLDVPARLIG